MFAKTVSANIHKFNTLLKTFTYIYVCECYFCYYSFYLNPLKYYSRNTCRKALKKIKMVHKVKLDAFRSQNINLSVIHTSEQSISIFITFDCCHITLSPTEKNNSSNQIKWLLSLGFITIMEMEWYMCMAAVQMGITLKITFWVLFLCQLFWHFIFPYINYWVQ